MSVYIVTWNLNKEGTAYNDARDELIDAISVYPDVEYHPSLDSVSFISTSETADVLYKYLKSDGGLDSNDVLLVSKIERGASKNYQGNLGKGLWDWINTRI